MSNFKMIIGRFAGLANNIKLRNTQLAFISIAKRSICSKQMRDINYVRPKPWPYETKKYKFWHGWIDNTLDRFDENTKIIVVDGPIAAGKSTFASSLADELDMKYFPEPTMDRLYINKYGYDLRQLDDQLPPRCRTFDVKKFYQDPTNSNVAKFQISMYVLRFEQYLDAMAHLLNTGQGVVLDRSIFSDVVFMETMHKFGYLSKPFREYYYECRDSTLCELLRPHLIIYLDVPVPLLKDRIKKRNRPYEVNSKVLTNEYLSTMEDYYKHTFLKDFSVHSELLIYDWSNFGDVEVIVEDIERIDFDSPREDKKFKDWRESEKWEWNNLRRRVTNEKPKLFNLLNNPKLDCPELFLTAEETSAMKDVMRTAPGEKYEPGFNASQGDKGIWFKSSKNYRDLTLTYWRE
ncbi:NADH dehydrogenase [ubiquinone] 1 alpha subcomplex subunit 10, mitochondrial [Centruroides vittatus]|uniref:NADH dehydrogenase [ubiquinone] 1 alpha subcomplex subunit 10, mitochondrial n=1 Tax=Centruroides vittatus TaxID=120091 RepID=UPI0035106398